MNQNYVKLEKSRREILMNRIRVLFNFVNIFLATFIGSGLSLGVCHESLNCEYKIMFILFCIFIPSLFIIITTYLIILYNYKQFKKENLICENK